MSRCIGVEVEGWKPSLEAISKVHGEQKHLLDQLNLWLWDAQKYADPTAVRDWVKAKRDEVRIIVKALERMMMEVHNSE